MKKIIKLNKSIIPSCDFASLETLKTLIKSTSKIDGVGGYKIGFEICLKFGIEKVVDTIRKFSSLPIIYDHQKAATDIPEMGKRFAKICSVCDAVILFPQSGPETEREWIRSAFEKKLGVIVGGEMTHKSYLKKDGGFISNDAVLKMYSIAIEEGVKDFVVPGNKPEKIKRYKKFFLENGVNPILYSPGFFVQGGIVKEAIKSAENNYHAIIGRGIYEAKNMNLATQNFVSQLEI